MLTLFDLELLFEKETLRTNFEFSWITAKIKVDMSVQAVLPVYQNYGQ